MVTRFLLAALFVGSAVASAQVEENGWEFWAEAIEHLQPSNDANAPIISFAEEDMLLEYLDGPMRAPTSEEQAILNRIAPTLELIQQAAACETYDAGIDFSDGFATLLPHLSPMRMGARLLSAQARASAATGNLDEAAEWLGVLGAIATQPSTDRIVVSSFVSMSIFKLADKELEQFIGAGLIDQARATAMLGQLGNLYGADPFEFEGAIEGEGTNLLNFLELLENSDVDEQEFLLQDLGLDPNSLPPQDLAMQREIAEEYVSDLSAAFKDPDRERGRATIQALTLELEQFPDSASLLKLLMPSLETIFDAREMFEGKLADRLRQLESVAEGRIKPEALLNAAIVWLDAGRLAAILESDIPAETLVASTKALLIAGLDAASIPKASFHAVTDEQRPFVEAPYLGHLRAIGRLLLLAAQTRQQAWATNEPNDAIDVNALLAAEEISAVLRLVEHLASDPSLAHAVLSASLLDAAVNQIDSVVDIILERERTNTANPEIDRAILSRLRVAMAQVPRGDPFGLRAAAKTDRQAALDRFWRSVKSRRPAQPGNSLQETLDDLPPDKLATLIAMGNGRQRITEAMMPLNAAKQLASTVDLFPFIEIEDAPKVIRDPRFDSIQAAIEQRPSAARTALRQLNLRMTIDIEQRIREAYSQIALADKRLRPERE